MNTFAIIDEHNVVIDLRYSSDDPNRNILLARSLDDAALEHMVIDPIEQRAMIPRWVIVAPSIEDVEPGDILVPLSHRSDLYAVKIRD